MPFFKSLSLKEKKKNDRKILHRDVIDKELEQEWKWFSFESNENWIVWLSFSLCPSFSRFDFPHLFSLFLIMRMDAFHSQGNDAHRLSFCDHHAGWWPRKPDRLTVASFNADLYHRERRGEESRAPRSLQFCASTALREMITGNRRIRSRVSAINPRFRFFFSFSSSSFQAVNRRHRRLCANVFRNGGESYACNSLPRYNPRFRGYFCFCSRLNWN